MLKYCIGLPLSKLLHVQIRCLHETRTILDVKKVQEIEIPVPWGHIAAKWWGCTNTQPLIGLHGGHENAGTFDTLVPLLQGPSFLAIDLPGHGLSSHYELGRPYYILDNVLVLRRIAKYFKWKTISLMGHSYGSTLSYMYAALFPECVYMYISIDCGRTLFIPNTKTEFDELRHDCDNYLKIEQQIMSANPPAYTYDMIVDNLYAGTLKSPTKESCKILLKRGMLPSQTPNTFYFSRDPLMTFHKGGQFPFHYLLELAPKISCHHLSIRCSEGILVGKEKENAYFKTLELIRKPDFHFKHHDIEGTHHVHLNNPERVAPLINNFLHSL